MLIGQAFLFWLKGDRRYRKRTDSARLRHSRMRLFRPGKKRIKGQYVSGYVRTQMNEKPAVCAGLGNGFSD